MLKLRNILIFVLFAGFAATIPVHAQDEIEEVDPAVLLQAPQNYWALPIVFKDTLLSPPSGKTIRIQDKRYAGFNTAEAAMCYADPSLVPRMQILDLNQKYLFIATVLQKGKRYYIIVRDLKEATVSQAADLPIKGRGPDPQLASAPGVAPGLEDLEESDHEAQAVILELASEAEQALYAFKTETGSTGSLLDEDSPYHRRAMQIIRSKVAELEKDRQLTSRDILTEYVKSLLIQSQSQPLTKPAPETTVEEPASAGSTSISDLYQPVGYGGFEPSEAPIEEPPEEMAEPAMPETIPIEEPAPPAKEPPEPVVIPELEPAPEAPAETFPPIPEPREGAIELPEEIPPIEGLEEPAPEMTYEEAPLVVEDPMPAEVVPAPPKPRVQVKPRILQPKPAAVPFKFQRPSPDKVKRAARTSISQEEPENFEAIQQPAAPIQKPAQQENKKPVPLNEPMLW